MDVQSEVNFPCSWFTQLQTWHSTFEFYVEDKYQIKKPRLKRLLSA